VKQANGIRGIRRTLRWGSAAVAVSLLVACGAADGGAGSDGGSDANTVTFGGLRGGVTSTLVPQRLADDPALLQKYGLEIAVKTYVNPQDLYPAMIRGDYNATFAPVSSLAGQAAQGVDVGVIATAEPDLSVVLLGKGDHITSAEQLRGKRIAALASAGVWLTMQAQIDEKFGLTANEDYEVVSVSDLGAGAAQVAAGTADYALAWEPFTTSSMNRVAELDIVLSAGELKDYKSWRLVVGVHGAMSSDVKERLVNGLEEASTWLRENPSQADEDYRDLLNLEPGIIEKVLSGTTNPIDVHLLTDEDIEALQLDLALLEAQGGIEELPADESFFRP
jgi:ABC-type nitrate/sulfonate/bicarbonate transport system substrate-binding protein